MAANPTPAPRQSIVPIGGDIVVAVAEAHARLVNAFYGLRQLPETVRAHALTGPQITAAENAIALTMEHTATVLAIVAGIVPNESKESK